VSSAEETAKDVVRLLTELDMLAEPDVEPEHSLTATGDPVSFARLARRFLGPDLGAFAAARV
jgi:glutamate racemase